jgi:hypothetical protein
MAAEGWTHDDPVPSLDTDDAAVVLGVTPQYVGRLAAQGRMSWLPTGRSGATRRGCIGGRRSR